MNIVAMIPARYAATRFPGKLMQKLGDKTVIRHTYDNTVATGLFNEVLVVTDRIAEAAAEINVDIVVNVQGDEPFVKKEPLEKLLRQFDDVSVQVASLMQLMTDEKQINDPNYVKVAVDLKMNSLFFSRSVIPYKRDKNISAVYYEHIGVYAFRKQALMRFVHWPVSALEATEKIECLRYLENGIPLRMVVVDYMGIEIDTPEDLERAARLLKG
jgi:3-deoxy-manno-octulosonate cytidylyltransferase (CMP-KDO synthetase)